MDRLFGTLKYDNDLTHVVPKKGRKWKKFVSYMKRFWPLYLMMLPMVVYLFIFSYVPMAGIVLAFKNYDNFSGIFMSPWAEDPFVHFKEVFEDPAFWDSFKITLGISAVRLLIGFPIPIIITILLNEMRSKKFSKGFQIASYLPHFISWVVIYGIFVTLVGSASDLQVFFRQLTGKELPFLTDPNVFFWVIILSQIWKEAGWSTIIYFAALAGINQELYEAADIDGASKFEKMIHVTLPGLIPAISINLILQASSFVYGGFDQIFAMTANFSNASVTSYVNISEIYLYISGISQGEREAGTAVGLFNSIISFIMILVANKAIKKIGGDGLW